MHYVAFEAPLYFHRGLAFPSSISTTPLLDNCRCLWWPWTTFFLIGNRKNIGKSNKYSSSWSHVVSRAWILFLINDWERRGPVTIRSCRCPAAQALKETFATDCIDCIRTIILEIVLTGGYGTYPDAALFPRHIWFFLRDDVYVAVSKFLTLSKLIRLHVPDSSKYVMCTSSSFRRIWICVRVE